MLQVIKQTVVINPLPRNPDFLPTPSMKPFENIVGKRENAGNQHFLLFPQCFLPFSKEISILQSHLLCRLQIRSIRTSLKFCRLGKELNARLFFLG